MANEYWGDVRDLSQIPNGPSTSLDSGMSSMTIGRNAGAGRGTWFASGDEQQKPGAIANSRDSNGQQNGQWSGNRGGFHGSSDRSYNDRGSGTEGQYKRNSEPREDGNFSESAESGGWGGGAGRNSYRQFDSGNRGSTENYSNDRRGGGGRDDGGRGRGRGRGGGWSYGSVGGDVDDVPSGGNGGFRGRVGGGRGGYRRDNENNGFGGEDGGRSGGRGGYRRDNENSGDDDGNRFGGRGGYGGGRGGGGGCRRDNENNGFGGEDDGNSGNRYGGRGGFSGRGGRGGDSDSARQDGQCNEDGIEERPPPYIPPEKTEDSEDYNYIPSGINFSNYENIPVNVSGAQVKPAMKSFESSGLRDVLQSSIKRANYTVPTPIQKNAIPIIMDGRDVMSCAQTGSGKTAAFLLPMLNKMLEIAVSVEPGDMQKLLGLIVAPTRELADQIETEALRFARNTIIKVCVVYGGTVRRVQLARVQRGVHLLVATPGRLLDFTDCGALSFEKLQFLVLDEADRMLDMGFRTEIERLLRHETMPPKENRQTLLFSATFPQDIQQMAATMLNNYIFVAIGNIGGANQDIEQNFYEVTKFEKRKKLQDIIDCDEKTMIFVQMKKNTDFIASLLSQKNIPSTSIHGDRFQQQREQALLDFRTGRMKCIVCTDVASRGLDIKGVEHVINYDLPPKIDDYVHRIGRTGRVGNVGKSTSFFDPQHDSGLAADLVKILRDANKEVPRFLEDASGGGTYATGGGRFGSRDIRNPRDFESRSNTDHYDGSANTAGVEEEESWD